MILQIAVETYCLEAQMSTSCWCQKRTLTTKVIGIPLLGTMSVSSAFHSSSHPLLLMKCEIHPSGPEWRADKPHLCHLGNPANMTRNHSSNESLCRINHFSPFHPSHEPLDLSSKLQASGPLVRK